MNAESPVLAPLGAPVGRAAELDLMRTFVGNAAEDGGALLLCGEAGVGKTVLLDAAVEIARTAELLVLRTAGGELLPDLGFAGLGEMVRPLRQGESQDVV
jgi:AAA ATPase domain